MTETTNKNSMARMTKSSSENAALSTFARSNIKSVFGSGIGRISLVLFGIVLAVMAAYGGSKLFSKPKLPKEENTGKAVSNVATPTQDPMAPVSTEEGVKRAQANAETASNAQKQGQAYVAPPIVTDQQLDKVATQEGATAVGSSALNNLNTNPSQRSGNPQNPTASPVIASPQIGGNGGQVQSTSNQQQATYAQAPQNVNAGNQQQQGPQVDPEVKKAVLEQIAAVMGSTKSGGQNQRGFQTYYTSSSQTQGQQKQGLSPIQSGQAAQQQSGITASQNPGSIERTSDPIANAGDTCYATLDNGINTDDTTIVLATLHTCSFPNGERFQQAKVIGRLEKAQDQVRVTFSKLRLVNAKQSLPIEAIAVTEEEARSGVGNDVNHHYFSRYFSLGMASLLSGYGRAAQTPSGTTVISTGATTVQSEPMTGKRQTAIALGEMGQAFASEIKRDFNRPTTVSAPRGMGIGVIFVNDVIPTK